MEVIRAEVYGFCFGVRRAIELAEAALHDRQMVNTLGPLVHNPQETARLAAAGIRAVTAPEEIESDTIVIRAHGASPETLTSLAQYAHRVVDATCPFVTKSQRIAQQLERDGYTLVIVGHLGHPEVQGILGYVHTPAYIVTDPADVDTLPLDIRPGVIAQTTVNEQAFQQITQLIVARYADCTICDTVCSATRERQEAARQLAAIVDAVYVVGGRDSSNTNRLAEICRQMCPRTYLIETAQEIRAKDLRGVNRVGVTAGASTPDWLIEHVVRRLGEI